MKNLFIHIGPNKTGTKTLQNFLRTNRKNLIKSHVLYPELGRQNSLNHEILYRNLTNYKGIDTHSVWDVLYAEIEQANAIDTIVLSSEAFYRLKPSLIRKLNYKLNRFNVSIIFYARRQDIRLESQYNQMTKAITNTPIGTINDFISLQKPACNYYQMLQPWSDIFGVDNIILKVLESKQIDNLNQDFLNTIVTNNLDDFAQSPDINQKVGIKSLIIHKLLKDSLSVGEIPLRHLILEKYGIDSSKKNANMHQRVINAISEFSDKNLNDIHDYHLIPHNESLLLLDYFKESNRETARKYLDREELFFESPEYYQHLELDINLISSDEWSKLILFLFQDKKMKEIIKEILQLTELNKLQIAKHSVISYISNKLNF